MHHTAKWMTFATQTPGAGRGIHRSITGAMDHHGVGSKMSHRGWHGKRQSLWSKPFLYLRLGLHLQLDTLARWQQTCFWWVFSLECAHVNNYTSVLTVHVEHTHTHTHTQNCGCGCMSTVSYSCGVRSKIGVIQPNVRSKLAYGCP